MLKILILMVLLTKCKAGCPSMCSCQEDGVFCQEKDLECVPSFESLQNDSTIIDLSGNDINYVDNDDFSFDKASTVIELFLNNSNVAQIEENSLNELTSLQELYLAHNILNNLPQNLIRNNSEIIFLDVSYNYFSDDMPKISSSSLEVLVVAFCKISYLQEDSLELLPSLKILLLHGNNLKNLPENIFRTSLTFLKLSQNPWECSCENVNLLDNLHQSSIIDPEDILQCRNSEGFYSTLFQTGILNRSVCNPKPVTTVPVLLNSTFEKNEEKLQSWIEGFTLTGYLIIGSCLVLMFLIGFGLGFYVKSKSMPMKSSDSESKLLCRNSV